MTVTKIYYDQQWTAADEIPARSCLPLLYGMALCSDAVLEEDQRIGDPTELALLDFCTAHQQVPNAIREEFPRIGELPFQSDRKRMTTLHQAGESTLAYTKGAADVILPLCSHIMEGGSIRAMTEADRALIADEVRAMSQKALRLLAFAMRAGDSEPKEDHLIWLGMAGMIDPPRKDSLDAIRACQEAGIRVIMITGDHKETAAAIGQQLGILSGSQQVLTGAELDELSDEELADQVDSVAIYARVDPRHKVRIVRALQAQGELVAMTGDGVNDAPSLRASNVGIAMGETGTDAAKDAADLVLTDDRFSTIALAVGEGRNIFSSIRKTIDFLLSTNAGELLTVLVSVLCAWQTPLLPLHILWINLITDSLPALALGMDAGNPDVMHVPPRDTKAPLLVPSAWVRIALGGSVIALAAIAGFRIGLRVSGNDLSIARTFTVLTLSISQLLYSLGVRAWKRSIFRMSYKTNPMLLIALAVGIVLQVLIVVIPPLAKLFELSVLSVGQWGMVLALSLAPLVLHEAMVLVEWVGKRRK